MVWCKKLCRSSQKIAPAVENIDEVLPEIEDLSVDEIVELAKYSMTELGLGGDIDVDAEVDAAVEKVNDAIAMGKSLLKMVNSIG